MYISSVYFTIGVERLSIAEPAPRRLIYTKYSIKPNTGFYTIMYIFYWNISLDISINRQRRVDLSLVDQALKACRPINTSDTTMKTPIYPIYRYINNT